MRDDPCFNIPGCKFALLSPEVVTSGSGVAILCPEMIISCSELSHLNLILSLFLLSLFPPLSSCSSFVSHGVCPIILSCFPLWYFVMTRFFSPLAILFERPLLVIYAVVFSPLATASVAAIKDTKHLFHILAIVIIICHPLTPTIAITSILSSFEHVNITGFPTISYFE